MLRRVILAGNQCSHMIPNDRFRRFALAFAAPRSRSISRHSLAIRSRIARPSFLHGRRKPGFTSMPLSTSSKPSGESSVSNQLSGRGAGPPITLPSGGKRLHDRGNRIPCRATAPCIRDECRSPKSRGSYPARGPRTADASASKVNPWAVFLGALDLEALRRLVKHVRKNARPAAAICARNAANTDPLPSRNVDVRIRDAGFSCDAVAQLRLSSSN